MVQLKRLKPFVPSGPDYDRSKAFFQQMGFAVNWEIEGLAELALGDTVFLLQDFHNQEMQENLMMYVEVDDLDAFWSELQASKVLEDFGEARANPPRLFPWGDRELHLTDPAGVCWHFAAG